MLVIAELKLSFTLDLVLQAVDRMRATDAVYLAVAGIRRGRDPDRRVHQLCRLLGLGLLIVDTRQNTVAVVAEPTAYKPRSDLRMRKRLQTEHQRRRGDPTVGGSTRQPIMTGYRQRALSCALALVEEPRGPRDLKSVAGDTGAILLKNVDGWFERVKRGQYRLTAAGIEAVKRFERPAELSASPCNRRSVVDSIQR